MWDSATYWRVNILVRFLVRHDRILVSENNVRSVYSWLYSISLVVFPGFSKFEDVYADAENLEAPTQVLIRLNFSFFHLQIAQIETRGSSEILLSHFNTLVLFFYPPKV